MQVENGVIFKKEIDGKIKWVFSENHYDGWGGFPYTVDYVFDTFYDAEHEARIRSKNIKYTSNFDRAYDKNGKETYKEEEVVFKIITPDPDNYWYAIRYNAELAEDWRKYNKSFWRKLFKYWFKPPSEYLAIEKTRVIMKTGNDVVTIFEGADWGEAEKYIRQFVKNKPIYKIVDGNTIKG